MKTHQSSILNNIDAEAVILLGKRKLLFHSKCSIYKEAVPWLRPIPDYTDPEFGFRVLGMLKGLDSS
jgi:hypothetical protein